MPTPQSDAQQEVSKTITALKPDKNIVTAQNVADSLTKDSNAYNAVHKSGTERSDYYKELNKDLEEKKLLPVLALAYVDKAFQATLKDGRSISKNDIDQYEKQHNIEHDSAEGMLLEKAKQLIGDKPLDEKNLKRQFNSGEDSLKKQAHRQEVNDKEVLVPIPKRDEHKGFPKAELDDLEKLRARGFKLAPNDHGRNDEQNHHSEVYRGPNGQVVAIDRDEHNNAIGYTVGNAITGKYSAYRRYANADPSNTAQQQDQCEFYDKKEVKFATNKADAIQAAIYGKPDPKITDASHH